MGAVFLGTPSAAIPSLAALADVEDVDLVITQPDRRAGRGGAKAASPVKVAAKQFGFPVAQPETREQLQELIVDGDFRIGVVVAYGRILRPTVLAACPFGFVNVHFSLLPRWRGAAPVERAIAAGDDRTGVTLMKIDEGLDTGPVLGEISTPIGPNETGGSLTSRLSFLGATLIDDTLPEYLNMRRRPVPQIASGVSQAKMLTKAEARLTPDVDAAVAERLVRAFQPRPASWIESSAGTIRIHKARPSDPIGEPGQITLAGTRVVAYFNHGSIELVTVQPQGKPKIDAVAWMHGRRGEVVTFE
jgi:methionyl-tRNA formyltransferase